MPFTNDPDYINSPDDCQTHFCHDCGLAIDDLTTAKHDFWGRFYLCAACIAQIEAENVPQDWTELTQESR
jgi:hypothetical protein